MTFSDLFRGLTKDTVFGFEGVTTEVFGVIVADICDDGLIDDAVHPDVGYESTERNVIVDAICDIFDCLMFFVDGVAYCLGCVVDLITDTMGV